MKPWGRVDRSKRRVRATPTDEPDLLARCRTGETNAYRILVERYRGQACRLAYRFLRSEADAEEVAQDAFVRAWRALPEFRGDSAFSTWLYRIATNACLNEVRRPEHRHPRRSLEHEPDDERKRSEIAFADPGAVPGDSALAGRQLEAKIREVLEAMPPNQRAALLMSRVDGLSYLEVADALETTESAVKSLVFRATATMRKELAEFL